MLPSALKVRYAIRTLMSPSEGEDAMLKFLIYKIDEGTGTLLRTLGIPYARILSYLYTSYKRYKQNTVN